MWANKNLFFIFTNKLEDVRTRDSSATAVPVCHKCRKNLHGVTGNDHVTRGRSARKKFMFLRYETYTKIWLDVHVNFLDTNSDFYLFQFKKNCNGVKAVYKTE